MSQSFVIITYGCKVNQYDSQLLRESLLNAGYKECNDLKEADLIIINGCVVTHRAERDARHAVHRAKREAKPGCRIILVGCAAKYGIGTDDIENIPSVSELLSDLGILPVKTISFFGNRKRPYLKVQEGCNFRCSYCVVPLVRGKSRSRPLEEIRKEALTLLSQGFREIVVTGTQVGQWGREFGMSLENLISELLSLPYFFRLRLSSISPLHVNKELLEFIVEDNPRLVPHFHMSLQSGSTRVLKVMRRPYTREQYIEKAEMLLEKTPLMALGTDIIVGFPGETDEDFQESLELVESLPFAYLHVFEFSPRRGTDAWNLPQLPSHVKRERVKIMMELRARKMEEFRRKFVGRTLEVLVESERNGYLIGTSENYLKVMFKGPRSLLGQLVRVKITEYKDGMLWGEAQSQSNAEMPKL